MNIKEHVSLAPLTTFSIGGPASYLIEVSHSDKLSEALLFAEEKSLPYMVLGGCSNIVVSDEGYDGVVIMLKNEDVEELSETDEYVNVKVGAGKKWDNFVEHAVDAGWWGIENLSLIPGNCGAVAVQNVGAYGQQVSDVVFNVEAFDTQKKQSVTLNNKECVFGYRSSMFNTTENGRYIITSITFRLNLSGEPITSYPDVEDYIEERLDGEPMLSDMRKAIITIRKRKFADPDVVGTVGSFFKNVYVSNTEYEEMIQKISDTAVVEQLEEIKNKFSSDTGIKIPTAFLIDRVCNLKGEKVGGAEVSQTQALAIINPDKTATAEDVLGLMQKIRKAVYKKTGLTIEPEPQFVGFTEEELEPYFIL